MHNIKLKPVFILFLLLEIQLGHGFPQGFFSQGFQIPSFGSLNTGKKLVSLNVERPINSFLNVFGVKNTNKKVEKPSKDQQIANNNRHKEEIKIDSTLPSNNLKSTMQEVNNPKSNKNDLAAKSIPTKNSIKTEINDIQSTTESASETTTEDYETTTIDDIFNRSQVSPQVLASLLG